MVVVREDGALPPHQSVQRFRNANPEPLHSASERPLVVGLDDEVNVVSQYGEVDQAEAEAVAAEREAAADPGEAATRPQVPDVWEHAPGDEHGVPRRECRPRPMRHLAQLLRLLFTAPTLSLPSAAPGPQM